MFGEWLYDMEDWYELYIYLNWGYINFWMKDYCRVIVNELVEKKFLKKFIKKGYLRKFVWGLRLNNFMFFFWYDLGRYLLIDII